MNIYALTLSLMQVICLSAHFFTQFPELQKNTAYISFAALPTPIDYIQNLALYIKRDDLTGGESYGGNKVRKLEFLLAEALACGAQEVVTFGCAGSNHALATTVHAHRLGLACTNLLKPQINSAVVQQNLLLSLAAETNLLYFPDNNARFEWLKNYQATGACPYVIPTGGSCPTGLLGFVNAAFELKEQIDAGIMTEPDYLYVAHGSCGTVSGLTLGFQLLGIKTHIMAIATEPHESEQAYYQELEDLYTQTNKLMHERDNSIPLIPFPKDQVTIRFEFAGGDYGMATAEGLEAKELFKQLADINLDNTYTSKAAAAVVADARAGMHHNKTVLYWNTYCGLDFSEVTSKLSYKGLPACFHEYFE